MKKAWIWTIAIILVLIGSASIWLYQAGYLNFNPDSTAKSKNIWKDPVQNKTQIQNKKPVKRDVEMIQDNLKIPREIVFTAPDRMLVTQRPGEIVVIQDWNLAPTPMAIIDEVVHKWEAGLMGMTLDPEYEQNKYLYVCYAYTQDDDMYLKVARYTDNGDSLDNKTIILEQQPTGRFHAWCRVKFGPDDKLYVSIWEATEKQQAQNLNSPLGKILRINKDWTIPSDNPWSGSAIRAYGTRNTQWLTWDIDWDMFSSDHGPSTFDWPPWWDEVNKTVKWWNYGWPEVSHEESAPGMIDPLIVFTPAIAPWDVLAYSGDMFPQWQDDLLVSWLKWETIIHMVLNENKDDIVAYQSLTGINYGRIRPLTIWPDGSIYFGTSNEDGRWESSPTGDKIYRIYAK